jgi:hypothetical protein
MVFLELEAGKFGSFRVLIWLAGLDWAYVCAQFKIAGFSRAP